MGEISYSSIAIDDSESAYGRFGAFRKDKILTGSTITIRNNLPGFEQQF